MNCIIKTTIVPSKHWIFWEKRIGFLSYLKNNNIIDKKIKMTPSITQLSMMVNSHYGK